MQPLSRHKILLRELFPFTFVVLIWIIHLIQAFLQEEWFEYAVYPRTLWGLRGIITSPVLHGSWEHLIGNTIPLLILGLLLFNSYKQIAGKVFWLIYLLNGTLIWLFARDNFHLGASGVIYGLASFLFFSGMIRRNAQLGMISLLIVFLYGSMVWGIFPFDPQVSWEGHLYGAITGLILSIVLRKEGPQPVKYWADEEEDDDTIIPQDESEIIPKPETVIIPLNENENPSAHSEESKEKPNNEVKVIYIYKGKE